MNGYNFTDRVRRVLQRAREEAARLGHDYVGSEHVLLGLLAEEKGQAATVLRRHKVDPADLKKRVEAELRPGRPGTAAGSDFPYTSGAKKVLESAMVAARELSHRYVGTEHLLLGLLYDEKGIPARLLGEAGLTRDSAMDDVAELAPPEAGPAGAPRAWSAPAVEPAGWSRRLTWPAFLFRWLAAITYFTIAKYGLFEMDGNLAHAFGVLGLAGSALLALGLRRREASMGLGVLLLTAVLISELGLAPPFAVGQLVWDMILLLPGLLVPAAIDRYSLDWRLSRRPRLR